MSTLKESVDRSIIDEPIAILDNYLVEPDTTQAANEDQRSRINIFAGWMKSWSNSSYKGSVEQQTYHPWD